MNSDPIRMHDLRAQHRTISAGLIDAVLEALGECDPILGASVETFEQRFADVCGTSAVVGCANGADAITLALRALDLPAGSAVLVPANAEPSIISGIVHAGHRIAAVDVDPATGLIDPAAAASAVDPTAKAMIAIHTHGRCAPMDALHDIARSHGLVLIEDGSAAVGATQGGRPVGSLAALACFDLAPDRAFGAFGDAGAIATSDRELAVRLRRLRDLGFASEGDLGTCDVAKIGLRSRLDTIQAKVLCAKIDLIEPRRQSRREIAEAYDEAFADVPAIETVPDHGGNDAAHTAYVIRVPDRAACLEGLAEAGVEASALPEPLLAAAELRGVTSWIAGAIALPIRAELSPSARDRIIEATLAAVRPLEQA